LIQFSQEYNKWVSAISMYNFRYVIGYYDTREEAAIKLMNTLKSIFGEAENRPFNI
jgi:hypothetical protein